MKNQSLFCRNLTLQLALLLFLTSAISAQIVKRVILPNIPEFALQEGTGLSEFQFFLQTGSDPAVRFQVAAAPGSPGAFSDLFCIAACPGSCPTRLCIDNSIIPGNGALIGTAPGGIANTYKIRVTATRTGGWPGGEAPDPRDYDVIVTTSPQPSCPATQKFALVLDQSGSMDWPSGLPGQSRWVVLKAAIKRFIPTLNSMAGITSADKLKVYFFTDGIATSSVEYSFGAAWMTTESGVETELFPSTRNPSTDTPLGAGMRDAFNWLTLGGVNVARNMIVFTDGVQTADPYVGGINFDQIPAFGGNPAVTMPDATNRKFKIFTIGVGGADPIMMNKMANPDNEFAQADVPGYDLLNVLFGRTIPAAQRYCSPRILDYRYGILQDTIPVSQTFLVNNYVRQLNIRLSTQPELLMAKPTLWKDGIQTDFQPFVDENTYRFVVNFPINLTPTTFYEPAGKWEVRFQKGFIGMADSRYEITAIVEDEYIHHNLEIAAGQEVFMGEKIPVSFDVDFGGKLLSGVTAAAWLVRPGEDLGDLAARTAVTSFTGQFEPGTDNGLKKIETLLRDSNFVKKIAETENFHALTDDGTGKYRTEFDGALVSGTYRVLVRYSGTIPGGSEYEGWELQSVLVKFAPTDEIDLQQTIVPLTNGEDGQPITYQIVITPKNKYGKLLGPGHLRHIATKTSTGGAVKNLTDNLDGSYTMQIDVPKGQSARLTINLLYEDKAVEVITVGKAGRPGFGLSLHLGRTIPSGKMDSLFNPGSAIEIDLAWRFGQNNRWLAELVGGYYHFEKDFNVLGATARGGYHFAFLNNGFDAFGRAGLGIYKPDNLDLTPGFTLGLGGTYHATTQLDLELAADYFNLTKPEYTFFNLSIGAKYFF